MEYKNIKVGMKLKFANRIRPGLYEDLKIGDILTVNDFNCDMFLIGEHSRYCITNEYNDCWEPVSNSLKSFLKNGVR